jgi:hypothetical protein
MANCQSPQVCSQISPRGGHVGRLVHRFFPSIRTLGVADWREWAPQLGRAPERTPAGARQSLNRRRAKSPHTAPAERPRRCSTIRHTFNLSTVIGERAAIATRNARAQQWPPHWIPYQLLRHLFALRGRRSFGRSRAASGQNPPGTDSNPNSLGPQPLPGRPGPERGPCIPGPTPRSTPTKIRDLLVFGALTYRGDCGWIECPNQLVGWGQPPGGARKSPRGR